MNSIDPNLINRYLSNDLTQEEKIEFEKELNQNPSLQKEVEFQKEMLEGIKRASTRNKIKQTGKTYHFNKKITTAGIILATILVASLIGYIINSTNPESTNDSESETQKSFTEILEQSAPIDNLASEFFVLNGKDSVVLSKSGVLLSIPENAFLLNGKPFKEKAIVQWQEAIDGATIVKSGLSTMADDRLLETQGMFGFQAYTEKGEKLTVNPAVGVYVQAPVNEYKKDMQLFSGEKSENGIINWVNPKPLMKIPIPVDMKELNFYPKGYEAKLDELKKPKTKEYRDSLYLSFDEGNKKKNQTSIVDKPIIVEKKEAQKNYLNDDIQYKVESIVVQGLKNGINGDVILKFDNSRSYWGTLQVTLLSDGNSFRPNEKYYEDFLEEAPIEYEELSLKKNGTYVPASEPMRRLESNYKKTIIQTIEIEETNNLFSITISYPFKYYSLRKDIGIITDTLKAKILVRPIVDKPIKTIPPSKVLAFWQPKFNNTLLSTREFERRVATIHTTCDEKLLNLYTSNLSKPIMEIDEMAVSLGYKQFSEFAKEQIGAVNPNSPHLKGLQNFYADAVKKLSEEAQNNRKKLRELEQKWNQEVSEERNKEKDRTNKREATNLTEEYNFNLKNVCKQLGKTVGFQIHGGGTIFNIDKYVMDATVSRTSTTIVDPETGKTAEIVYNPFSFTVKEDKNYPKLYAYLFPSELNSYQRISPKKGTFDYPLNNDIQYDVCIVGIADDGYYYQEVKGINKGDLGELSLNKITESELDHKINALNEARGIVNRMSITDELSWLIKEQKNYVVQKRRKEEAAFRNIIKKVIFPCFVELSESTF